MPRTYPEPVIRYVPTHINREGMRTLATPCQGRHTYATPEEAQAWIDAVIGANPPEVIARHYGAPIEVRPCPCWPVHFDPVGIYFD